jgi:hypothetical protein
LGRIVKPWSTDFSERLQELNLPSQTIAQDHFQLLSVGNGKLMVNLLNLGNNTKPEELLGLQDEYKENNVQVIHLWEDVWSNRQAQVLGRLQSFLGMNAKVHARKTSVIELSQLQADEFLNENHLQHSVGARFRYGLVSNGQLVAVACFSRLRKMHNAAGLYTSAELIRFANLLGVTVIGGFSKLLSHFINLHQPNDIMSYADKDWSLGSAYERSGFSMVDVTDPCKILVHRETLTRVFPHRLPENVDLASYQEVYNTGNLKYILPCE